VNVAEIGSNLLSKMSPRVAGAAERSLKRIPSVRRRLDREYGRLLAGMEPRVKPYRDGVPAQTRLPGAGRAPEQVIAEMEELASVEEPTWREGFVSGAVYHGDREHV
jgi:sphinganine-1-phosphate aldolase